VELCFPRCGRRPGASRGRAQLLRESSGGAESGCLDSPDRAAHGSTTLAGKSSRESHRARQPSLSQRFVRQSLHPARFRRRSPLAKASLRLFQASDRVCVRPFQTNRSGDDFRRSGRRRVRRGVAVGVRMSGLAGNIDDADAVKAARAPEGSPDLAANRGWHLAAPLLRQSTVDSRQSTVDIRLSSGSRPALRGKWGSVVGVRMSGLPCELEDGDAVKAARAPTCPPGITANVAGSWRLRFCDFRLSTVDCRLSSGRRLRFRDCRLLTVDCRLSVKSGSAAIPFCRLAQCPLSRWTMAGRIAGVLGRSPKEPWNTTVNGECSVTARPAVTLSSGSTSMIRSMKTEHACSGARRARTQA
jgi:hypothetical protein